MSEAALKLVNPADRLIITFTLNGESCNHPSSTVAVIRPHRAARLIFRISMRNNLRPWAGRLWRYPARRRPGLHPALA
jgi:hypothetical protein